MAGSSFDSKSAIIVGGGSSVGTEIALKLLSRGARVVCVDVPAALALATADERLAAWSASGALHSLATTDFAEEPDTATYVEDAVKILGGIDIAVFSTVVVPETKAFETITEEEYDLTATRSVRAVWLGVKHCARAMTKVPREHEGVFLLLSSSAGLAGSPGLSAFTTAQWAIRGMGQSAAQEFAPLKIRTNTLHPALDVTQGGGAAKYLRDSELANVAAFLVSEKAGYINGVTVTVDGATVNWG